MNMDNQPTQPLASSSTYKQPINYHWVKALSDASGVRLMYVHRFLQGKPVPVIEMARIKKTMHKLIQMGGEGEA